jgi:uncharacterized protein with FMN-binding domain
MTSKRSLLTTLLVVAALGLVVSFKTPTTLIPAEPIGPRPTISAISTPTARAPGNSPATSTSAAPTATAGASQNLADGAFSGPSIDTNYGPVQVKITRSGGVITDVTAVSLPSDRSRSAEISAYAAPILRSEALKAQSASIDTVSGATYTSDGYRQSLQAAIDAVPHG